MKFLSNKPVLRRTGWTLVCLLTLVALFYTIENWRGARRWQQTRSWLESEGEAFEFAALTPDPVPDDQNFTSTPLLASLRSFNPAGQPSGEILYSDPDTREQFKAMQIPSGKDRPDFTRLDNAPAIDLAAWAEFLDEADGFETGDPALPPAERILAGFRSHQPLLDQLTEAANNRAFSQFPTKIGQTFIDLVEMPVPHLVDFLRFSQFLGLRSAAALATGDTTAARNDILVQLRLAEAAASQPLLISHLIEVAMVKLAIDSVWEGLRLRAWSDDDLQWLDTRLGALRIGESALRGMRGEMVFYVTGNQYFKSVPSGEFSNLLSMVGGNDYALKFAVTLAPDGWFDQNAARGCELLYQSVIRPLKEDDFAAIGQPDLAEALTDNGPYTFLARMLLPAVAMAATRSVHCEARIAQARIACALERHFIATGNLPADLQALEPDWLSPLPADVITGEPMNYTRENDRYRLYSVGWNRSDDGGAAPQGKQSRNLETGDWVWAYPPAADADAEADSDADADADADADTDTDTDTDTD